MTEPVEVTEIETVTGDFLTEPGPPFYRIEIDGYCADFDYREAAENFAAAINRLSTHPTATDEAADLIRDAAGVLGDLLCDEEPGTGDPDDDPLVDLLRRFRAALTAMEHPNVG